MAPLKDKKKKKRRPRKLTGRPPAGKQIIPVFKTGMNRDIPMGGAGGSQNLIANLLASRQAQPPASAQVIQTPDQFKLAQDIKSIKTEQADIAEEVAIQKKIRKERADKGLTKAQNRVRLDLLAAENERIKAEKMEKMRSEAAETSNKRARPGQTGPAGRAEPNPFEGTGRTTNKAAGGAGVAGEEVPKFDLRTKKGKADYEEYKRRKSFVEKEDIGSSSDSAEEVKMNPD